MHACMGVKQSVLAMHLHVIWAICHINTKITKFGDLVTMQPEGGLLIIVRDCENCFLCF